MRIRIIAGVLLLPALPLVLFIAPDWVLAALVSLLSAVSVWEVLGRYLPKRRVTVYTLLFSAGVPLWFAIPGAAANPYYSVPAAGLFLMLLFAEAVLDHKRLTFAHIGAAFTSALFIPVFFSSLIRIAAMPEGKHLILLPFVASILGDTCAYFTGVRWGRHKLSGVSPKKTAEGAAGGLAGVLAGMALYGAAEQFLLGGAVSYPLLLLYGLLGGLAGQLGDLSMSLIKREFQIKDFGSLIPGHGGILDRFDSLLFAAPVIELLIVLLPAISVSV